jgi:hypothetical protein
VFLGDDSTTKIVGRGRVRLTLQDGRSRTLPGVLHILGLERNLIYVSKMSDAGVHTLFQKDTCKMVRGVMVLMKGVQIGTLYKLLGNVDSTGCNNIIVPEVDSNSTHSTQLGLSRFNPTRQVLVKMTRPCYGTRGWDILEKKDFELCITKVWSKIFLNVI